MKTEQLIYQPYQPQKPKNNWALIQELVHIKSDTKWFVLNSGIKLTEHNTSSHRSKHFTAIEWELLKHHIHRRVPPLLLHRFHLQNLPVVAGNRIHSEEQPVSDVNQLHLPHRAFLHQPNGAWRTAATDWELLREMALLYRPAAVASTAGFLFQCLNDVQDSPWWPWSATSGAQDGKSHYESPRPRQSEGRGIWVEIRRG
jgi:hypothetical protein